MKTETLAHRAKILHLKTAPQWAALLPAVIWRNWCLAGDPNGREVLDLSGAPLEDALRTCYPTLGLSSLAQLASDFSNERETLFASYGLRWSDRLDQILAQVRKSPAAFQDWIEQKAFSPRELQPLVAIENLGEFYSVLERFAASHFTRAQGAQALEWAVDLFLLGHPLAEIVPVENDWFLQLKKLRRPQESKAALEREASIREWPWPAQTSARWDVQADLPVLEIRVRAHSPEDLQSKVQRLADIAAAWKKNEANHG